ncbi:MAG: hypothetical protein JW891_12060 [Candidatus Lokiarchaeota archaeon]|nr:hypothetical protein [Candidatus Lokiarchaeota archaeon]
MLKQPTIVDDKRNFIFELADDYEEKLNLIDKNGGLDSGLTPALVSQICQVGIKWMQVQKSLLDEHINFSRLVYELNKNKKIFELIKDLYNYIFAFDFDSEGRVKIDEKGLPINSSKSSITICYFERI